MTVPVLPAVAAACALLIIAIDPLWVRARYIITVIHEGGHGLAAVLSGRRLTGIRLHRDTSGTTLSSGRRRGLGLAFTAGAGYLAPPVFGLAVAAQVRWGSPVYALAASLVLVAMVLLYVRNFFGLLVVLVCGLGLAALVWRAPQQGQLAACYAIAWFLVLGGLRDTWALWGVRRRGRRTTDVDILARCTLIPAVVWNVFFIVLCAAAAVLVAVILAADLQ